MKSVNDPRYARFLKRLKEARDEAKISQLELAGRLGKHQTYVSKIERGDRMLDLMEFLHWVHGLGADPIRLLEPLLLEFQQRKRKRTPLL